MECPYCKSDNVRRSRRRGLREGLLLRIILWAPFRCRSCQQRFWAFSLGHHRSRGYQAHSSLASFLGFPKAQRGKFDRAAEFILLAILLILFGVWLAIWLARPSNPIQPPTFF
jgi:hypothetical protein